MVSEGIRIEEVLSQPRGVWRQRVRLAPDGVGPGWSHPLALPAFRRCLYFAPFQRHAINPDLDLWPEAYNQCHPLPIAPVAIGAAKRGGIFALFELAEGGYLALLPLVSGTLMTWLHGAGDTLALGASHFGNEPLEDKLPLLAVAIDESPYRAIKAVWASAREACGTFRLRSEKALPEMFGYLGWCTWEQYRDEISEPVILEAITAIERSGLPIRWMLIDDGHLHTSGADTAIEAGADAEAPDDAQQRKLLGFEPERGKFPQGWERIRARLKQSDLLRWSGIWLNFNGYWGGIAHQNELGPLNDHLLAISSATKLPADTPEDAGAFYAAWIERQAAGGFDFVKVDNMGQNIPLYRDHCANAVRATHLNHQALETAVDEQLDGMVNCMAHNNLCVFNARHSPLLRCSEDYAKENLWRAKHHLHNSFSNMLWMGQVFWGDHDMFHSSDTVAAPLMARSKAVSGGPIYLSDDPAHFNAALVKPLCLESGKLLMPLAPAVPVPDSLFTDPYEDDEAFAVVAPLAGRCAAWVAYNLTSPEKPVRARLTAQDYAAAGEQLGECWQTPPEGLLVWDPDARTATVLGAEGDDAQDGELVLPGFGDAFRLLVPVVDGWALIGAVDKVLSPQACTVIRRTPALLEFTVPEPLEMLVWTRAAQVIAENADIESVGANLWAVRPRPTPEGYQVRLLTGGRI
ncbi:MAG: Sip1-related alpha-galactosidase [Verrucomicrobiota bacterium JB024]|nr:Sip1-related alpha-galactosidase [Verrucomicrobiota bacterium JB024]